MIKGSKNVPKAFRSDSGPKYSRKSRTPASSRQQQRDLEAVRDSAGQLGLKLLESTGNVVGIARIGQKVLNSARGLGSAVVWGGIVAAG